MGENQRQGQKTKLSGIECYPCNNIRRRNLANKKQKVLNKEREEHKEIEDKFQELRADFVSGRNELKYDGEIDTQMIIELKRKAYKDKFVEGQLVEIWEFAQERMLKADTDEELIALIREKYEHYTASWLSEERLGWSMYRREKRERG